VDRITRKELKQDKFAVEVTHTVGYLAEHRTQAIRYGIAGLVVVALVVGFFTWRSHERAARRDALTAALEVRQAPVGPSRGDSLVRTFPTEQDKNKAQIAAFSDVAAKYPGTDEGSVAQYYLGTIAAEQGNLAGAAKAFQEVADSGSANYASMAKLSLAEIYKAQGKAADGEKLIRSVMDKPTEFVSKEQATIALARYLASSNPAEARKLLTPLQSVQRNAVSRIAVAELTSMPAK
jgi:predicted negative regulator of RcsB-dependent stress response